jgi:iron(III) transport system substrate-binding protein
MATLQTREIFKGYGLLVAATAMAACFAAPAASAPKSAVKLMKGAGMDPAVLNGSESDFAGLGSIVSAAKKESTLKFRLTFSPKHAKQMLAVFKERYPFAKVEYTRGVGAGRAVKPLAAFKTGRYIADIVGAFGSSMKGYTDANAMENISGLPSFNNIPKNMRSSKGEWAAYQTANWCMAYNTQRIKKSDLPKTWKDLVKSGSPLAGGRVGVGNRVHLWLINLWGAYGPAEVTNNFLPAFFGTLKPQLRKEGINGLMKLASIGEFDVSMPSALYRIKIQVKKGAKLAAHCPEPVPRYFTNITIFRNSPRVNTAKLLVNWLLSKEGQVLQSVVVGAAPVHKDLIDEKYYPYGEELKGKQVALRDINLLVNELPKAKKVWNKAWREAGGPSRKKRKKR